MGVVIKKVAFAIGALLLVVSCTKDYKRLPL